MADTITKKSRPKAGDTFGLKIYAPFKNYYEGDVLSVSAVNDTGPFDILAGHHNFITLLNACDLVVRGPQEQTQVIKISRGIMQVKAHNVTVFLDV